MRLFTLKSNMDFRGLNQTGINCCLHCSVSLSPSKQGILGAPELCEAIAAPSQQSLLASALKKLWRMQDGGLLVTVNGTTWPFSLPLCNLPSECFVQ